MRNALESDLGRISVWTVVAAATGFAGAALSGILDDLILVFQRQPVPIVMPEEMMQVLLSGLTSEPVLLTLPVLAALPFTTAFLDDCASRYVHSFLPRSGLGNYIASKAVVTAISGGGALVLGALTALSMIMILLLPLTSAPAAEESADELRIAGQTALVDIMASMLLLFLSGALWSLVGANLAVLTTSRYAAYAAPFVFFYLLVILAERYFYGAFMLNPKEWISPSDNWPGDVGGAALFIGELVCIFAVLYALLMKRRLRHV
ncbi:MAG: hypothetical protein HDQ87_11950 [Clostridia bacterium]|nr:hypothetical protein [Clostridia bacterium]